MITCHYVANHVLAVARIVGIVRHLLLLTIALVGCSGLSGRQKCLLTCRIVRVLSCLLSVLFILPLADIDDVGHCACALECVVGQSDSSEELALLGYVPTDMLVALRVHHGRTCHHGNNSAGACKFEHLHSIVVVNSLLCRPLNRTVVVLPCRVVYFDVTKWHVTCHHILRVRCEFRLLKATNAHISIWIKGA